MNEKNKAEQWIAQGRMVEIQVNSLFVVESKNQDSQLPFLVILHGYPTCSYDYHKVLTMLSVHFRVVIHDHLGFGFSDKPKDYSYTLIDQCDVALQLWERLGITKAHVLAHDYGTSVATELVARDNHGLLSGFEIKTLTLCNGSMHIELAQLRLIQRLLLNRIIGPSMANLSNRSTLAKNLKQIYFDSTKVSEDEVDALWHMMIHNKGKAVIHQTTQYIKQRKQFWYRWIGALQQTQLPVHVLWAENDPVAVIEMAEVLNNEITNAIKTTLPQLGHFPMLESPDRWGQAVLDYLLKA
ncbi:alpha/beta fold hydrolase [Marinicella rhabdoformis]|uniref:alpha/beta fold hydrolase n=1 Tax=Marinicella rhabdoformis TaxID=2580566 RepID=UPI0012AED7D5|nr:alpha/beta hydrolase [Marinicella rhabdoformis]